MLARTDWYPSYVKPLREGTYEIQYEIKIGGFVFGAQTTIATYRHSIRAWDTPKRVVFWRGLTEDPVADL
jgi:hypothetical protein